MVVSLFGQGDGVGGAGVHQGMCLGMFVGEGANGLVAWSVGCVEDGYFPE